MEYTHKHTHAHSHSHSHTSTHAPIAHPVLMHERVCVCHPTTHPPPHISLLRLLQGLFLPLRKAHVQVAPQTCLLLLLRLRLLLQLDQTRTSRSWRQDSPKAQALQARAPVLWPAKSLCRQLAREPSSSFPPTPQPPPPPLPPPPSCRRYCSGVGVTALVCAPNHSFIHSLMHRLIHSSSLRPHTLVA